MAPAWPRVQDFMGELRSEHQRQLLAEFDSLPEEHLPLLLQMVRAYRQNILLKPAAESFRRGWQEIQCSETLPADSLWEGIDAE